MSSALSAPFVPGVSAPPKGDELAQPSLLTALRDPDLKKAASLAVSAARAWYDESRWYYREATECVAFYFGNQWGVWSDRTNRWIATPQARKGDQTRRVLNVMKPVVDTAVALLTQEVPIFGASAAKSEVKDAAASTVADAILNFMWTQHRLTAVYRQSGRDSFLTGMCPILVEWDPTAGEVGPDEMAAAMAARMGQAPPPETARGDLRFRILAREAIAFEPGAQHDQDGCAILVREKVLRSTLKDQFPEAMEGIADTNSGDDFDQDRSRFERAESGPESYARNSPDRHVVEVYTAYIRKCAEYPRGAMVKFCDQTVLYWGDNPIYPRQDDPDALWPRVNWPVFFAKCDERVSNPWGRGRGVDMLGPQRDLNGIVSKAIQHVATIANTKVTLPRSAEFEWDDNIGQVLRLGRFDNATQLGYLSPPPFPQEFVVLRDRTQADLEYIAGINSATMGQSPTSDASGRLVQTLQNRDTGRIAPVKRELDNTWAEIMRYALVLFRRHATTKRKIVVVGENDEVAIRYYDGADLAAATDVKVFNDQSIPRDPTQRMLWLTQFGQAYNAAPDPNYKAALLRLARIKDFEGFLLNLDPSEAKAQRMIETVLLGKPVYIWPGDDAMAMAKEIDRYTSRREYELRVAEEKAATNGFSVTEAYLSQLYAYYKGVATGMAPPAPAGEMPIPQAPPPPPTPMGTPLPPMPMGGGGMPQMNAGAPMPDELLLPPVSDASPSAGTPTAMVG